MLPIAKYKLKYLQVTNMMMAMCSVYVLIHSLKCDPDLSHTWDGLKVHSQGSICLPLKYKMIAQVEADSKKKKKYMNTRTQAELWWCRMSEPKWKPCLALGPSTSQMAGY